MPWDDQSPIFYEMEQRDLVGVASQVVDRRDHLHHVEQVRVTAQKAYHDVVLVAHDRGLTLTEIAELSDVSVTAVSKIVKAAKE